MKKMLPKFGRMNITKSIFAGTLLLSNLFACKEYTVLPPDLVPAVDNVNTFQDESQLVLTHNIYQDSMVTGGLVSGIRVGNNPTFYHAIGNIENDLMFGSTAGASHIEVVPPVASFSFKTNYAGTTRTIDSVVLSVPYHAMYGDSLNAIPQTFNLYRSLQRSSRESTQYEFTKDEYDRNLLLGSQTIDFKTFKTDSPFVGKAKVTPQLRFKINQAFVSALENQVDLGVNGAAVSTESFLNWCNGFYIKPANTQGSAIGYFNTYGTRLNIYYRYTNANNLQDTINDVFGFDPNTCNRFNTIERSYASSAAKLFLNTSTSNGDSVLFVQSDPGLAATIRFPNLANFENVIVNKAELVFTQVSPFPFNFTELYGAMPRMQILQTINGKDAYVRDYAVFGTDFVNGFISKKMIGGVMYNQYKFNISNSIQRVISQKDTTFSLKIMGQNTSIVLPAAYRVILQGSGSQSIELKPTLNLIYTKLK
jgi:hypothetical protein